MRIAFIITPRMLATSLSNAYELLFAAQQAAAVQNNAAMEPLELVKVAANCDRITLPSGLSLMPDQALSKDAFDMVYLPALWRNPRAVIKQNQAIVEWVRWQYEHGAIINSTGTGVCFLAEAGLLNGKPATTHWHHFDQFARDYPQVQLKRQHFITHTERIFCAASINAQTDLTLHHVQRFFNKQVAEHLSRHFSHEVRQPFDKLSYTDLDNSNHPDEIVLQAQLWMQNHLSKAALSMRKVAKLFGMSQRNFTRRFKQATDMTPVQYLQSRRLAAAKDLLQNSNLSIKEIAYRVGYVDVSYFTKIFKQYASVTPKEYRTTVRAKLFDARDAE
ncbi:MAG: helix-turn-helix domain-containing protein [Gammaproteobacteria bacterium]|nr:helix-turn-helix domain-containing protein [Gammaproteobacteria bacterium]